VRELNLQSGHKSEASSFQVIEASVSRLDASPATPRRRWSAAAKERIVAEATKPGANVSAIARAHGLTPQQVFTWRRDAVRKAKAEGEAAVVSPFAAVAIAAPEAAGAIELIVGGVTLRIGPAVSAARVKEILRVVRSA